MNDTVRPTKKQRELLAYIEQFIQEHGYSPSYREIMNGLDYTSVATVSLHVNSLIRRGHLRKRDRSARSLEVVGREAEPAGGASGADWLIAQVEQRISRIEKLAKADARHFEEAVVLMKAVEILGHPEAATSLAQRIHRLSPELAPAIESET